MSIAVGYVSTKEGQAALEEAIAEAARRQTTLEILWPAAAHESETYPAEVSAALALASGEGVSARVRTTGSEDDPADVLIDASFEDEVDLVVIGVRRRSPLGKLFLGSTAQRVILEAGCPVTAVKPEVGARS
ncbi:universal stress protein [Arthrobacter sp. YAF17]|uniref:universal stress protein n=1 Tax=Arthrobacter sp. YAF17 TaxID=3233077 RepID=UPI003F917440